MEQASKKEPSYADFLDELLNCEVEARRIRYMRAKLQLAHLPFVKLPSESKLKFESGTYGAILALGTIIACSPKKSTLPFAA